MSRRVIPLLAFSVCQILLAAGCRNREPVELVRTGLSDSWPKFTSTEEGFEIKHPPDWHLNQSPGVVSFSAESANVGIRRLDEPTRKQMEALFPHPTRAWWNDKKVKIGELVATQSSRVVGFFDDAGNMDLQSVTIERGSFTYMITWSLGRGLSKAPKSSTSVCEEMVATFRFVDVKHSDYLSYVDPAGGFTFDYPYKWILSTGMDSDVHVVNGGGALLIRIGLMPNTTFKEFLRWQGNQVTNVEERKEHFLHRLVGRRFRWLGRESYALENQNKTYLVSIREAPALGEVSRKSIDDFLNSLRF